MAGLRDELERLRMRVSELEAQLISAEEPARLTAEQRSLLAVESAGMAWWDHDFVRNEVTRSGRWAEMLGYDPEEVDGSVEAWKALIHPEDLPEVERQARSHESGEVPVFQVEHRMRARDGSWRWILNWGRIVERDAAGRPVRAYGTHLDITRRKQAELDREQLIVSLEVALAEIKTLRGIIPICAGCKKIRDDQGYWNQLEAYLTEHSEAQLSHGLCPDCRQRLYPDLPGSDEQSPGTG